MTKGEKKEIFIFKKDKIYAKEINFLSKTKKNEEFGLLIRIRQALPSTDLTVFYLVFLVLFIYLFIRFIPLECSVQNLVSFWNS